MRIVTEHNFDENFPPHVKDLFWRGVELILVEVLQRPKDLAKEYRKRLEDAPIAEQMLAFHEHPLNIALDLAGEDQLNEQQAAIYRQKIKTLELSTKHVVAALTAASGSAVVSGSGSVVASGQSSRPVRRSRGTIGAIMSAIFGRHAVSRASGPPLGPFRDPPDVEAILNGVAAEVNKRLAAENKHTLDWRRSIVDLMKLLDLDASLEARKQLARELHYTGNMGDSAKLNVWLHKKVMETLAQSGSKVPDELRH
jgi:hypothetical protein